MITKPPCCTKISLPQKHNNPYWPLLKSLGTLMCISFRFFFFFTNHEQGCLQHQAIRPTLIQLSHVHVSVGSSDLKGSLDLKTSFQRKQEKIVFPDCQLISNNTVISIYTHTQTPAFFIPQRQKKVPHLLLDIMKKRIPYKKISHTHAGNSKMRIEPSSQT